MIRLSIARGTLVVLTALAAACGYDATTPYRQPPAEAPPDAPPVGPTDSSPDPAPLLDGLWTSSGSDPALLRLGATQLAGSGTVTAGTTVTTASASLVTLNSIAFDDAGTMWVASQNDSLVLGFASKRLDTTRLAIATRVISSVDGSLAAPTGLAFDRQHRLWVANSESGTIVRYEPVQLAGGGALRPTVTLAGLGHPTTLAFDSDGALWCSDSRANRIAKFDASRLATSGAPAPDVVIESVGNSLRTPAGIAFDADGRLWVANSGSRTVVGYDSSQLAASGATSPFIVISPSNVSVTVPTGLAFDQAGALWVVSSDGLLAKYDRSVITASGQPQASATLRVESRALFWSLAFWPKVQALPIN